MFSFIVMDGGTVVVEKLDRGLIALEREDGSVFLSWRLFAEDPEDLVFQLARVDGSTNSPFGQVELGRKTCHVDRSVKKGEKYTYSLSAVSKSIPGNSEPMATVAITITGTPRPYIAIPLQGDYDFQKVGIADLDGDGEYEYLIKQPDFNTDPYQQPGYWKKSPTTYKIEAYKQDGTFLWRHDMGWSIEAGIWYSPWVVYDVDQDGKAEVYCKAGEGDPRDEKGLVQTGPEYLVKLDGATGKVVAQTDWLTRDGFEDYNYYCRNFLAVAYLDGKTPSLIMQRGTYRLIKTRALDKDFKILWDWQAEGEYKDYRGQGSHGLISADVDRDGRDELVLGAAVLDDDGQGLWTLKMGHPDICYVADIHPGHPGLEIFYGFESRQETDGICVVDAQSGKKLWAHKKPTRHLHGQGLCADFLTEYPGMEVFCGERDLEERWLYSADGQLIQFMEKGNLNPRPVWWDADPQKEFVFGRDVRDWEGDPMQTLEGKVILIADCLGDHREEIITSLEGELRIYSTTIPTDEFRPCLMQDRQYRLGIAAQTMGYYYPAQLGLAEGGNK
ncbi:MAG TPA: silent information regulator protein Sir2 [bacterium]|nr:silent information regulator protein Sir2 [bacterium]